MVVVALAGLAAVLYLWAERAPAGRSRPAQRVATRRATLFLAGLTVCVVALSGPLEQVSGAMFWPHMIQHVLLVSVAAPLFVLASPWAVPIKLVPARARPRVVRWWRGGRAAAPVRRVASWLALPVVAWVAFDAALVAWHIPAAFDLSLRSRPAHDAEHLLFLGLAVAFWIPVLDVPGRRARLGDLGRAGYLLTASVVAWLLAVVLTLAPDALYAYDGTEGLSALADQRIAGGIMLVPGSLAMLIVMAMTVHRWLGDERAVEAAT
jgi:cytochrome c oxidase assembly factor CtaG